MSGDAIASTDWPVSDSVPVFAPTCSKDTRVALDTNSQRPTDRTRRPATRHETCQSTGQAG